mgnify:CR=1 FL=1
MKEQGTGGKEELTDILKEKLNHNICIANHFPAAAAGFAAAAQIPPYCRHHFGSFIMRPTMRFTDMSEGWQGWRT